MAWFAMVLVGALFASSNEDLLKKITQKQIDISYYFFSSLSGKRFLTSKNLNGGMKVWYFTPNRDWYPIHNAGRYGNLPAAKKILSSVEIKGSKVSFGLVVDVPSSATANWVNEISGATFDITHYFFQVVEGNASYAYLVKPFDGGSSLYAFTDKKQWRPLHNARAFDGFPKANHTIDQVRVDLGTYRVHIGRILDGNVSGGGDLEASKNPLDPKKNPSSNSKIPDPTPPVLSNYFGRPSGVWASYRSP